MRQKVSEGFDRAKAGEAVAVYKELLPCFEAGQLPRECHYPFAWVIYYASHQSHPSDIEGRKRMLANYLKLQITKPHKLHSMILQEATRLYRDMRKTGRRPPVRFSLVRFAALWDLRHLRPNDWKRKPFGAHPLPATVESFITHYMDDVATTRTMPSQEFMQLMDRAVQEYDRSAGILAQRAMLHTLNGEKEQATVWLVKAVKCAPSKFWLWHRLALSLDAKAQAGLRVACLYKALKAPGRETFKGRIRLSLAESWLEAGAPKYALAELQQVQRLYESQKWHLPTLFHRLMRRIPAGTLPADPRPHYLRLEPQADTFIYSYK